MAYNSGFPMGYQPAQMYYPQQMQNQQQPQQSNGIIWVQGEAGAKSYLVAPNTTVQLWDSESQVIYLKSADASGMPSMKVIEYTIRGSESPSNGFSFDSNKFISRDEFNGLKSEFEALKNKLDGMRSNKAKKETING